MPELFRIFLAGQDDVAISRLLDRRLGGSTADEKSRASGASLREKTMATVREVVEAVRLDGDRALLRFTARFDGVQLKSENLRVSPEEIDAAWRGADPAFLDALRLAKERIERFHRRQLRSSWFAAEEDGTILGQQYTPLRRVGVYTPGGTAAYPSSVLMNVIPAQVAGVEEICLVTPPGGDGRVNPAVLAAAREVGVDEIYRVGGAQAVAALAFGTRSIPRVDKIVGPGNLYVALAKRLVFGEVGIDMLAGPSEIAIIADATARAGYVAADLLSQAEHDPQAAAILITTSRKLAEEVGAELLRQLAVLPRREKAEQAVRGAGGCIVVNSVAEAVELANRCAPEHLELMVAEPFTWLGRIRNAGAIFLGPMAPEPIGDYVAGTNHVLPTNATAWFASGLGVEDFLKRTSVIATTSEAIRRLGPAAIRLAEEEGLDAHARAVKVRLDGME
ncbi:MAG: histidinol dehydrogenase [Firmicutes bacterium]|nr:histidinol dehydrogenase [Bacillota bacterium]